ncbi:MAG: energy transducer TonB [Candidatus Omnitrophica bacterium]|nr:energy transducer TonB [Candidatus Omnitrophota bacterium]
MDQENTSRVTLLVSLLIHAFVLISLPYFKHIPQKKELTILEVTYRSISGIKSEKERGGISKELLSIRQKGLPKTDLPEDKIGIRQPHKFDFSKLFKPKESIAVPKPQTLTQTPKIKKISLKSLPVETSKDPAYLSYRDIIRRKIQDKVYYYSDRYFYFDNPREGSIFVSFTVSSKGKLKELSILEDKSSGDMILRKISTTAIKNASPFQKFPKDLNYDERTFNLEISFEIE